MLFRLRQEENMLVRTQAELDSKGEGIQFIKDENKKIII